MDRDESTSTAASGGPSNSRLPVEVCEQIIDYIAAGWDMGYTVRKGEPHLSTLTSCALVCQDWYYLTWYYLRQIIHLRDRKDVLSLSKTLRAKPRLREVIRQIVISGAFPGECHPIRHLGTFATMLAGKLPMLWRITIEDAEWPTGSVRMEDIGYLATFSSINTLVVRNVILSSAAQLSRLVSALPWLRKLWCNSVSCLQEQQVSPASLPLNSANMEEMDVRWVAPAVEDLFAQISRASRVREFNIGVDDKSDPSSAVSRSQTLLDASSTSAEKVGLEIVPSSPIIDGTIDATVEQHYNLSRHDHLWRLDIYLNHPFAAWPWVPHILSRITSKHFQSISVVVLDINHTHNHLDDFLVTMEQDGVLGQLDDILQEKYCSSTSLNVCLGFFPCRDCTWDAGKQCFGTGSTLQEQFDRLDGHRWDKLVRQKMPHSNGRGILATAHNIEERFSWGIRTARVEQTNTGGEV